MGVNPTWRANRNLEEVDLVSAGFQPGAAPIRPANLIGDVHSEPLQRHLSREATPPGNQAHTAASQTLFIPTDRSPVIPRNAPAVRHASCTSPDHPEFGSTALP